MKEQVRRLSPLEKGLAGAVLVGLLLLLFLNFRSRDVAAQVEKLQQQVQQTQERLRKSQPQDLPALQERLKKLQENPVAFAKKQEAEAAMVYLWDWAGKKGVRLLSTKYSVTTITVGDWLFPQHIFSIEGLGGQLDIVAYFQALENSPFRVVRLDDWTMKPATTQGWNFTFTLNIWSEGQKKEAPRPPGGKP